MSRENKLIISKKHLLLLVIAWMSMQAYVLSYNNGIITGGEAPKYFGQAKYILATHSFYEHKYIFYAVYIFLHVACMKLCISQQCIYIVQLLLNLAALWYFLKLCIALTKNIIASFFTTMLFISCIPYHDWTAYLYTDSVFGSLLIIFAYHFYYALKEKNKHIVYAALLFFLLCFERPTGLLLILPVYAVLLLKTFHEKKWLAAIFFLAALPLFAWLINYSAKGSVSYDFTKPFIENNVLCYLSVFPYEQAANGNNATNSVENLAVYIFQHSAQSFHLMWLKFISFWSMQRPQNSFLHNLLLALFFYPLYFCAIAGFFCMKKENLFRLFILFILIIFSAVVMLSCDDYDSRFNIPEIPFVFLLAAPCFSFLQKKFTR